MPDLAPSQRSPHGTARWPDALRAIAGLLAGPAPLAERALAGEVSARFWQTFLDLAIERHRVAPALAAACAQAGLALPEPVAGALAEAARANMQRALALKAETARLLRHLGDAGCRALVLKGWPLAEELAGSAGLRHAGDLDLQVAPEDAPRCCRLLLELGYRATPEHRHRARLLDHPALLEECNDLAFESPAGPVVELHWRSNHFRGWPDLAEMGGVRRWPLDATGIAVFVPSRAANLVYLALHGQQHAWARLKWLHDIALARRVYDERDLAAALGLAEALGARRALVTALHLAAAVFGTPLPPGWPACDRRGARMIGRYLAAIAAPEAEPGSLRARVGFYWTGLVMAESARQRLGVLRYALLREPRLRLAARR